jgi:hypothetical protein
VRVKAKVRASVEAAIPAQLVASVAAVAAIRVVVTGAETAVVVTAEKKLGQDKRPDR